MSLWDKMAKEAELAKLEPTPEPTPEPVAHVCNHSETWRELQPWLAPLKRHGKRRPRFVDGDVPTVQERLFHVNGVYVKALSRSALAQELGVSVWTIKAWAIRGCLPISPLVTGSGHRYYTYAMRAAVVAAFVKCGRRMVQGSTFYEDILRAWTRMGLAPIQREVDDGDKGI